MAKNYLWRRVSNVLLNLPDFPTDSDVDTHYGLRAYVDPDGVVYYYWHKEIFDITEVDTPTKEVKKNVL